MSTGCQKAFSATFSLAKSVEKTFSEEPFKEPFPGTMNLETAVPFSLKVVFYIYTFHFYRVTTKMWVFCYILYKYTRIMLL
jgi:hypothetical protein